MTTLELLAVLRVAIWRNDINTTARLIDELEIRMDPAELADLLEEILAEEPAATEQAAKHTPILVVCA